MTTVAMPDGTQVAFPDDMPADDIRALIARKFPQEVATAAKPKAPDVGQGTALKEGYLSGISANFSDEVYAASKASGLPDWMGGFRAPIGAGRLLYEQATRKPLSEQVTGKKGEATEAHEKALAEKREIQKQAKEQYPLTYLAGNVGGAVVLPGGAAVQGATLPARIGRGAIVGGAYGAAAGAGEGEDLTSRATGAAAGGVIGAGAGAAAVPVGELVARGAGAAGRYVGQVYRGFARPEEEGQRRVAQQVLEAQQRGGNDAIPIGEMVARQAEGQPVTVLDVAGQGGRKLARSAKNTPGADDGTQAMQGMVEERFRTQADRTSSWLDRHTPWKSGASFERILEDSRSINAPAYRQAYNDGRAAIGSGASFNPDAFMTPELRRLAGAPDIADAFGSVARKEGNRTIIEGFASPRQTPFARDANDRLVRAPQGPNSNAVPDLPAWDQVQRVLRAKASAATQAGDRDSARQITLLREQLLTELDRIVPSFQTARGTAWRGFRAEDAYEAGGNYVASTATGRDAQALTRQINNMTANERHLFAAGFAQELIAKVRGVTDSADVVRRIYNSPAARARIEESLGPRLSRELDAFLHVEAVMNFSRNAVQGNSTTVAQLLSAGMAGSLGYGAITGNWDVSNLLAGAASAGGRRVLMGAQANLANRVGQMLSSNDPRVFAGGVQVLARSRVLLDNLRVGVDRIASRAPGQHAGEGGRDLIRSVTRADSDGEPVPRPVD